MWLDEMTRFFKVHADSVSEIFDASGCREGWLQGELFRYFRKRKRPIDVNTYRYPNGGIADLSAVGPPPMVGEIKLLGGGYQSKVITGGGLRSFLSFEGTIRRTHGRQFSRGSFGLLPDYTRLTAVRTRQRLLVLVIDQQSEGPLSPILETISFDGDHNKISCGRGIARIWKLN